MDEEADPEVSRSEELIGLSGSHVCFSILSFSYHGSQSYYILAQTQAVIRFLLPHQLPQREPTFMASRAVPGAFTASLRSFYPLQRGHRGQGSPMCTVLGGAGRSPAGMLLPTVSASQGASYWYSNYLSILFLPICSFYSCSAHHNAVMNLVPNSREGAMGR